MAKKKVKKEAAKQKGDFFVAVKDPGPIRISLLESTKKILESMKLFKEIKDIRKQKIEEKIKLRKQVRQIFSMLGSIKSSLPHVNLPAEDISPARMQEPRPEKKATVQKPQQRSELERIESELMEIENKLSNL